MNIAAKNTDLSLILRALLFAADKHRDQRRKDLSASPYINHPIAVAETLNSIGGVQDAVTLACAVLHDTLEDTQTTSQELEQHFGSEIRQIVEELTDDKSLPSAERKQLQVAHSPRASEPARLVKLADKICNVRDIVDAPPVGWSITRRREYIIWARSVVHRLRGTNPDLERYFDKLCLRALEEVGDDSCI